MSGNSILVDTNIILYLMSGDRTIIPLLLNKNLYVSFITQLEMLSYKGLKRGDLVKIKKFLSECTIMDVNSVIKEYTIDVRKKYSLKIPDSIIVATALYLNIPLITADTEFQKVKDANLILYQK